MTSRLQLPYDGNVEGNKYSSHGKFGKMNIIRREIVFKLFYILTETGVQMVDKKRSSESVQPA